MLEKPDSSPNPNVRLEDGTIGVEYSPPPPVPATQEIPRYVCANCKGDLVLRAHSCAYCESEIDWSSLDA